MGHIWEIRIAISIRLLSGSFGILNHGEGAVSITKPPPSLLQGSLALNVVSIKSAKMLPNLTLTNRPVLYWVSTQGLVISWMAATMSWAWLEGELETFNRPLNQGWHSSTWGWPSIKLSKSPVRFPHPITHLFNTCSLIPHFVSGITPRWQRVSK